MMGEGPVGHGFGVFGWIFQVLIWLLPILLIIWLIFAFRHLVIKDRTAELPSLKTPREILDERYAKGEIDHEEYERRRADLDH